jgi:hypothetical protein
MDAAPEIVASRLAAVETLGADYDWSNVDRRAYRAAVRERHAVKPLAESGLASTPDPTAALALAESLEALYSLAGNDPVLRAELDAASLEVQALRG